MRVQCDVCKGEAEAAVFCCADEAALCGNCDDRVHSANKLAGKHRRISLVHPDSPQQFPLCDICKEKRALLFCQEDRAILCRDCDAPIHDANDLTRKHSRFLLTGIRLSPFAAPVAPEATASLSGTHSSVATASTSTTASADGEHPPATVNGSNQHSRHGVVDCAATQYKKPRAAAKETTGKNSKVIAVTASGFVNGNMVLQDVGLCSRASAAAAAAAAVATTTTNGSSISEYLMKELPGWHVEDLLLESCPTAHPAAFDFSKMPVEDLTPFREEDMGVAFPPEDGERVSTWWVPQVPQFTPVLAPLPPVHGPQQHHAMVMGMGGEWSELLSRQFQQQHHQHRRWTGDDGFTVPELVAVHHKPPPSHKRSRPSSWCMSS